ncbi:MAG: DUF2854 domain-containing protein [Leptolyngbyaceae bacterium]|nr:DUF2854 domain-containing protein [Leptolyngbyaceae bacterium]
MLRQISLGTVGLWVGGALTIMGFAAYALDNATLNLVGFFYGIPILLGGLALKAAELKPVPSLSPSPEILVLRKQQATNTQNQIRKDVTRFRYGQEAHLDTSLERLGLSPSEGERPVLKEIKEEAVEGAYALILEFESPLIALEVWQEKQEKIATFFGPGIRVEVAQPRENDIDVALISVPQAV